MTSHHETFLSMTFLKEDLRSAFASLRGHLFSSFLVVLMLGLGIGGNALAFSWIDVLLLRPLPFENPERLVYLDEAAPSWNLESTAIHYGDFDAWQKRQTTFEAMAVLQGEDFNLSGEGRPEHVAGARVTHDLFRVLGVEPVLGRLLTVAEDAPGAANVVLLGHGLWQRRFGGRTEVLEEEVFLDGEAHSVLGVLPPEAGFPIRAELWVPLRADPGRWSGYRLTGLGRLKEGVDPAAAAADLRAIQELRSSAGQAEKGVIPIVGPLRERYFGKAAPYAWMLWGVVGCVLLIACANVACLLLVHGLVRRREFGIRSALGADRLRLWRHVFGECCILATLGGLAGGWLGVLGLRALLGVLGEDLPFWATPRLDVRVFLFCFALSVGVMLLFGTLPYCRMVRRSVLDLLGTAGRAALGRRSQRLLRALVSAEIALALTFLSGTVVLLSAFFQLRTIDPGFEAERVLTFRLHLPAASYDEGEAFRFYEELRREAGSLPGVRSASTISALPFAGPSGAFLVAEGASSATPGGKNGPRPVVLHRIVAPDYFETMGIALLQGRSFDERDGRPEAPVVIVNQSFARRYWPGEDPIGRRVRYGKEGAGQPGVGREREAGWMRVVGLAQDVRHEGLDRDPVPGVYVPLAQRPTRALTVVVRGHADPRGLVEPVRALVADLDPRLPIFQIRTMEERLEESLLALRLIGRLAALFLVVALVLAVGGIYGVTAYSVRQRTREIAVRIALGARPFEVRRWVLLGGVRLVAFGAALGSLAAVGVARGLRAFFHEVAIGDLGVLGLGLLILALVAMAGVFLPARRAARLEPAWALRE